MSERPDPRPAGRPRRSAEALIRDVHAAVLAEVAEVGPGRLTMDGIATRAATAKTSLYRRWSSPQDILLDALYHLHPQEMPSPSADDLRGDLIRSLRQLVAWIDSPSAAATAAILLERQHHPELADALYEKVFDARGGRFTRTILRHYADRGHIDPELVTPVVADIGEALVFKYVADTGRPPDGTRLAEIVDQAILPAVGIYPDGKKSGRPV